MLTEEEIKNTLRRLGVKTSNHGYSYISYGILLTLKDESYLEYITKNLYVDIAHNFHTSGSCVERDIRTAIESIWKTEDTELLLEICDGAPSEKRPANKKFFSMMHSYFTKLQNSNVHRLYAEFLANVSCEAHGGQCAQIQALCEELFRLKEENERLKKLLQGSSEMQ